MKEYIRPFLIILLIITTLLGFIIILAGSHGGVSMQNKQTAFSVYSGVLFILTIIPNFLYFKGKNSNLIAYTALILNLTSGIALTYILKYMITFNMDGGHFPIWVLIGIFIMIILLFKLIFADIKRIKNYLQQYL